MASLLKKYDVLNEITSQGCGCTELKDEIALAGCVDNLSNCHKHIDPSDGRLKFEVYGDAINDLAALDLTVQNHDGVDTDWSQEEPELLDIIHDSCKDKHFSVINWGKDLKDGVRLHSEEVFSPAGDLLFKYWYNGYVDTTNKGTLVIREEKTWTLEMVNEIPVANEVIQRDPINTYFINKNGDDNPVVKTKPAKPYPERYKKAEVGKRKRNNVMNNAQDRGGAGILYTGSAVGADEQEVTEDIKEKMTALSNYLGLELSTWEKSGRGDIYTRLLDADTIAANTWLDADLSLASPPAWQTPVVPAWAAMGLDSSWATKKMKDFLIDKLKGLV